MFSTKTKPNEVDSRRVYADLHVAIMQNLLNNCVLHLVAVLLGKPTKTVWLTMHVQSYTMGFFQTISSLKWFAFRLFSQSTAFAI